MLLFYFPYLVLDGVLEVCGAGLSMWQLAKSGPLSF